MPVMIQLLKGLANVVYFAIAALVVFEGASYKLSDKINQHGKGHTEDTFPTHQIKRLLAFGVLKDMLLKDAVASMEKLPNCHQNHTESRHGLWIAFLGVLRDL